MDKFKVDLSRVENMLDPNRIPVKGNEKKFIRVAFDLFRVDGDESDDLWQMQADDNGIEFLVRTYSLPEDEIQVEASDWSVLADKKYANLTVSFKGVPLTRLTSKNYGANTPNDGKTLQGVVFNKLASDAGFVMKFINNLPENKKVALKQAGLLEDIKNWLKGKDITDPIVEEINDMVDQAEPEETLEVKPEDTNSDEYWEKHYYDKSKGVIDKSESNDGEWKQAFDNLRLKKEDKSKDDKCPCGCGKLKSKCPKCEEYIK